MPFSLVPLVAALEQPFLRSHALAGTVTGGAAVAVLVAANLLPAWLGIPLGLPLGLWLGISCLRGMMAALAGQPPPELPWISAWLARLEPR